MLNRKLMVLTIALVSLLAISTVSASEDVDNDISISDDSMLQSTGISDTAIESTDNDLIFNDEDDDVLKSTDDDVQSFVEEDAWFNDKIIWYDGDWDNVKFGSFEYVDNLENPKNITIKLSCEDNPVANVDLAFLNDYDNKITKLTTDSDGIAVYNIPFNVNEFSFCVSFWYDENHMISCVDIGPNMIYSFDLNAWNNTNCDENTVYNNHSQVSNDTHTANDTNVFNDTNNNGTFTELQNLIDSAPSGSIIYLENDYKIDNEFMWHGSSVYWDGLKISKSLTIDGKGHSLNGGGEVGTSRILTITNDVPVTLRNIRFSVGSRAITAVSNLNIINCTFTDNVLMVDEGGAIYCSGKLTVKDSNFTGNAAFYIGNDYTFRGGAIICGKDSTISNSTFNDNTANRGSAVSGFNSGDVTLTDCTFYENTGFRNSMFYHVNIIVNKGNVVNCRFGGYKSSDNLVDGDVINCVFTEDSILTVNDVTKFYGGSDKLQINLVDSLGNGIGNADVYVVIDDGDIQAVKTDSNGHASLDLNLTIGDHDVFSSYNEVLEVSKVSVLSTITAEDATGVYSDSKVSATFLNTDGKALASRQVTFKINGKDYPATTNSNGVATANVDLGVGSYNVTAVNPINNEQKQFNLVIFKANSQIALAVNQNNGVVTLTATLTPASAMGNVVFTLGGKTHTVAIKDGKSTLTLTDLNPNDYVASATYNGDSNLNLSSSNSVTFTVLNVYPILTADDVTKFYGGSEKLQITLVDSLGNKIGNVNVNVNINGNVLAVKTDSEGKTAVDLDLAVGNYDAVLSYEGVSTTSKITVKSTVTVADATCVYSDSKVSATFLNTDGKDLSSKPVTFKVNGKEYATITNSNGVATANVDLDAGNYNVTAVNPTNNEEKQFNLVITKVNSQIALTSTQNNGVTTLTATLAPESATGNVAFNVSGEIRNAAISNGKATLTLKDLAAGNYIVTASYNGDKNMNASTSNTVVFSVADVYPVLTANGVTKTYGTSTNLVVYLKDSKGNAIANAVVNVVINDMITPITTDSNGQATMAISLKPANYDATVTYSDVQVTAKIVVKKANPKLTAKAKTFKKSDKTKKYTLTLKTNQNKVMKNTKVTIKVNKVTYSATTNAKGQATFKITKLAKKGKYTGTITYKGNAYYNKLTKNVKITVK